LEGKERRKEGKERKIIRKGSEKTLRQESAN